MFSLTRTRRYGIAVVAVALVAILRLALDPFLGEQIPLLLFVFAIILSAWYGGLGPGLLATALSLLLGDYLFVTPRGVIFRYKDFQQLMRSMNLGAFGVVFSLLADRLRKSLKAEGESMERFRLLVEGVRDYAIFMLDPQGRVVNWNSSAERITGYREDEIVGRDSSVFYTPEDIEGGKPWRDLEIAAAKGRHEEEGWRVRKDGSRFWASVLTTALRDDRERLRGFARVVRDLTERKLIDEALRERERFVQHIVEVSPSLIYIYDIARRKNVFVNRGIAEALGYDPGPEASETDFLKSVMCPEDWRPFLAHLGRMAGLRDGETAIFEYRVRHTSGEWRWFHSRDKVFARNEDGSVRQIVGTATDITERKRVEEKSRFMADLSQALRLLTDPEEIMATAARMLGEHLGVDRCGYGEIGVDEDYLDVMSEYTRGETPSIVGRFGVDDLGAEALRLMRKDRPYVVNDVEVEMSSQRELTVYRQAEIRALVCVPLVKSGHFVARLAVSQKTPRRWSRDEIELVTEVANQCWESVQRARAIRDLRESEERYRAFIEHSSEAIWRYELEKPIPVTLPEDEQIELMYKYAYLAECNDAMARMYGYEKSDDLVGARIGDLFVRSDPRNIAYIRAFKRSGYRLTDAESYEVDREGNIRYFLNNTTGIVENGAVVRAWGTQRDITEQKRAEAALRQSEERLRRITEATQDALWEIDLKTRRLWWSERARPLFGHSPGELNIGLEDWYNGIHPEDVDRVRDQFENFLQSADRDWIDEYRFRRADGSYVYILDRGRKFYDESGRPTRIAGAMSDITERKRAEEALRESEQRFARFMRHLPGLAWIKDTEGRYVYANDAALKVFRTSREKLYGKTDDEIFPPEIAAQFKEYDREALTSETGILTVETLEHGDGILHYSLVSKFSIPDQEGRPSAIGGIAIDITESKRAEEALRESEERYRLLTELSPDGVVIADFDGAVQLANRSMLRMLGAAPERVIGRSLFDFVSPEFLEHCRAGLLNLMTNELPETRVETAFRTEDGRSFPAEVSAVRFEWKGQPLAQIIIRDISGRKQAEAERERLRGEIEAERDRLRQILERMPVGVSIADAATGRLLFHNPEAERLLRHPLLRLGNQSMSERYAATSESDVRPEPEAYPFTFGLTSGEAVKDKEVRYLRGDGTETFFSVNSAPIRDQEGRVDLIVTTFVDIAERKRAEEALRESEERFAKAFRQSPDALAITRLSDGVILEANDSFISLSGYDQDELIGKSTVDLGLFADSADRQRALAILREQNFVRDFEFTMKRKSGETRLILFSAEPIELRGERCWITIGRDITERKKAEEALRRSEEQARRQLAQIEAIYATAPVGLCYLDTDLRFVSVNDQLAEIDGVSVEGHLGRTIGEVLPEVGKKVEPIARRVIETGEPALNVEKTTETPAQPGVARHFIDSFYPIKGTDGRVLGVNVVVVEITQRKNIEEERERLLRREKAARAEAEAASRMKDEFLATISHELRTPLTSILGWARMLTSGSLSETQERHAVDVIAQSAQSQSRLIDDILDTSRIITGRLKLDAHPVEIERIFQAAIDVVRPSAEAKGISLRTVIEAQGSVVLGDANRLQQAIWNLLSNAVKFTNEGGRIEARLAREGGRVEIGVTDTGIGIEPQFLPHVFDQFRQADSASTRKYSGLGLGLAIVRHIIEMHGGSVSASSLGKGQGATFRINLPLAATPRSPQQEIRRPESEVKEVKEKEVSKECQRLDGVRVLVVEDNPDTLDMLRFILTECGAEVIAAESADEALEALERWRPDVLVSDIAMPGKDGYELIREVRSRAPERGGKIPAVAVTAYARAEDRMRALASGFQMHVAKPVDPDELIAVVASLTGHIHF